MYREKRKLFRENSVEQYIGSFMYSIITQKIYAAMTCGAFKLIPSLKLFGSQQNNLWLQYGLSWLFAPPKKGERIAVIA